MIGASNKDIAFFAGVDRSGISRIKSGNRIPKPSSISTVKLINGIFLFADEKNEMKKLMSAVSCTGRNPSPDEIKQHILQYLYEGYREQPVKLKTQKPRKIVSFHSYGTKLDAVMNATDFSNMNLARMLHIDASAVSRFRNGLRTPKSNPKLTNEICECLFRRALQLDRMGELLELAGIPKNMISNEDECFERFSRWLCDFETENDSAVVEKLLENISSFSVDAKIPLPSLSEAAPDDILTDTKNIYYGTQGLRCAVIRFLGNALKNKVKELWLYSDQNMDWMVRDINFRLKWAALMLECVKSGIKIRIIHNLNRDINELTEAISSWLPLYMSGMIESFYCTQKGKNTFSHTIFLCPGFACIEGLHVAGHEGNGLYRYDTDKNILETYKDSYNTLLDKSKKLVWVYRGQEQEKVYAGTEVSAISNTLSLATMPKKVLNSIIERNGLDGNAKAEILSEWKNKKKLFEDALRKGFVHECITVADDETLFSGKVPVDLRNGSFTYTLQEYKEHIINVISLSESHSNYRFYALPENPFTNTNIIFSETSVAVTRLIPPQITFTFSHPAMCEAFLGYANHLKEQYKQDRITVRRLLERYI